MDTQKDTNLLKLILEEKQQEQILIFNGFFLPQNSTFPSPFFSHAPSFRFFLLQHLHPPPLSRPQSTLVFYKMYTLYFKRSQNQLRMTSDFCLFDSLHEGFDHVVEFWGQDPGAQAAQGSSLQFADLQKIISRIYILRIIFKFFRTFFRVLKFHWCIARHINRSVIGPFSSLKKWEESKEC